MMHTDLPQKFQPYTRTSIRQARQWDWMAPELQEGISVLSALLPFRTNAYVLDNLIDWNAVPDDPVWRLVFPHRDMLAPEDYARLKQLVIDAPDPARLATHVHALRLRMNPHPAGQLTHNVPQVDGQSLPGIQHKYRETVLFFPSAGQTCHAYCTFCFRWPQFAGMDDYKFDARASHDLVAYLRRKPDVSDVLITGGDPMIMTARALAAVIEPLLVPELGHVQNIRIGTKSLAYWPQRFVSDRDADELLQLFEKVAASGRQLSIMAHFSHAAELRPAIAQRALRRILASGASVRMQAPLIRHVNEDPASWVELWTTGVRLGAIPYYMFVERDTGPRDYFALPLARAYDIFTSAYRQVSGLARTVRGPSMSAFPGKVLIDGITTIAGEQVFALQFLQARDPALVRQPFYARFDPAATWLDQLKPAFGAERFPFEVAAPRLVPIKPAMAA